MLLTDLQRGQLALKDIEQLVAPHPIYIGGGASNLYKAEDKRSEHIKACATEWAKVAGVSEELYWKQSIPQALHDVLDSFDTQCAIVAAEAFLKRFGWKVERPSA